MSEKADAMTEGRGVRLLTMSRFMVEVEERSRELVRCSSTKCSPNIILESARLWEGLFNFEPSIIAVAMVMPMI